MTARLYNQRMDHAERLRRKRELERDYYRARREDEEICARELADTLESEHARWARKGWVPRG